MFSASLWHNSSVKERTAKMAKMYSMTLTDVDPSKVETTVTVFSYFTAIQIKFGGLHVSIHCDDESQALEIMTKLRNFELDREPSSVTA